MKELKEIEIKKLSGGEIFQNGSKKLDFDLQGNNCLKPSPI